MILGIDIGGTTVKMGLVDETGTMHARHEASVCFDAYQTPVLATVISEAVRYLQQCDEAVEGIGVSATGQIDIETGAVIGTNGKIPNYEGAQIKRDMEKVFGVPVFALNDANAAVLGECFAGRAKGMRHVLMVTLGTGVGGGVLADGKLLGGARGIAGELGHFTLRADGMPCACGRRGCYENYASMTALLSAAREACGEPGLDGRAVFERARCGDGLMRRVLARWISDVADGLSGLVHIFNPQMVLLGGGVSAQEELFIAPVRERVFASVMPRFAEKLQIERALLGNNAGMIGAAGFCMGKMREERNL